MPYEGIWTPKSGVPHSGSLLSTRTKSDSYSGGLKLSLHYMDSHSSDEHYVILYSPCSDHWLAAASRQNQRAGPMMMLTAVVPALLVLNGARELYLGDDRGLRISDCLVEVWLLGPPLIRRKGGPSLEPWLSMCTVLFKVDGAMEDTNRWALYLAISPI